MHELSKDNTGGNLTPAKQSSLTANSFAIKEQCMERLLTIVENHEMSLNSEELVRSARDKNNPQPNINRR